MNGKVVLEVVSGPIKGQRFEFDSHDTFLFGRGKDCRAKLPKDSYVSRHHFLLEVNPPQATVRDLGSLNGTQVNKVRYGGQGKPDAKGPIQPASTTVTLKHGDRIRVGNTVIRVRIKTPRADGKPLLPPKIEAKAQNRGLYVPTQTEAGQLPQAIPEAPLAKPADRQAPVPQPPPLLPAADAQSPTPSAAEDDDFGLRRLIQEAAQGFQGEKQSLTIDGYTLAEVLGEGAMGTVYKASRGYDAFPVAIKVMMPKLAVNESARQRFLREIDVVRELNHPNIATLLDSGSVGEQFYFVMDYCNGGCVADLAVRQGGRLSVQVLAPIMLQTAHALEHAHQCGFVHRDLKPANLLLHQQGGGWQAKLGDFGLAKHFEQAGLSGMTLTGTFGGTYDYMPREQLTHFRSAKPTSDVWSIAATFYRLLTGASPRECPEGRDPMEVVLREKAIPIRQRNPQIPPGLAGVLDLALQAEADLRYSDGAALRQALEEVLV